MGTGAITHRGWAGYRWFSFAGFLLVAWLVLHVAGIIHINPRLATSDPLPLPVFALFCLLMFAGSAYLYAASYATAIIDSNGIHYRFFCNTNIRWADVLEVRVRIKEGGNLVAIRTQHCRVSLIRLLNFCELAEEVVKRVQKSAPSALVILSGTESSPYTRVSPNVIDNSSAIQDKLIFEKTKLLLLGGIFFWGLATILFLYSSGFIGNWLLIAKRPDLGSTNFWLFAGIAFLSGSYLFACWFSIIQITHQGLSVGWIFIKTLAWKDVVRVEVISGSWWHKKRLRIWTRDVVINVGGDFPLARIVPLVLDMVRSYSPGCLLQAG
jgi:hypothetical protein